MILADFTARIDRHPGSACTEITFVLRKQTFFFGWFSKYTIERSFQDYINMEDMSYGMPGVIGSHRDTYATFWSGFRALDAFMDLQIEMLRGQKDDEPIL